jgi:hypothetical protein
VCAGPTPAPVNELRPAGRFRCLGCAAAGVGLATGSLPPVKEAQSELRDAEPVCVSVCLAQEEQVLRIDVLSEVQALPAALTPPDDVDGVLSMLVRAVSDPQSGEAVAEAAAAGLALSAGLSILYFAALRPSGVHGRVGVATCVRGAPSALAPCLSNLRQPRRRVARRLGPIEERSVCPPGPLSQAAETATPCIGLLDSFAHRRCLLVSPPMVDSGMRGREQRACSPVSHQYKLPAGRYLCEKVGLGAGRHVSGKVGLACHVCLSVCLSRSGGPRGAAVAFRAEPRARRGGRRLPVRARAAHAGRAGRRGGAAGRRPALPGVRMPNLPVTWLAPRVSFLGQSCRDDWAMLAQIGNKCPILHAKKDQHWAMLAPGEAQLGLTARAVGPTTWCAGHSLGFRV